MRNRLRLSGIMREDVKENYKNKKIYKLPLLERHGINLNLCPHFPSGTRPW